MNRHPSTGKLSFRTKRSIDNKKRVTSNRCSPQAPERVMKGCVATSGKGGICLAE